MHKAYKFLVAALMLFVGALSSQAQATDITSVISSVDGYRTAAIVVGVAILLFVIGRRVVRKLI